MPSHAEQPPPHQRTGVWGATVGLVHPDPRSLSVSSLLCRLEKESIQQSFSSEAKAQALQAQQRAQELTQKMQQMEAQHDRTGRWWGKIRARALAHKPGPRLTVK